MSGRPDPPGAPGPRGGGGPWCRGPRCPGRWFGGRGRRPLRRRLTWAFVLVAAVSLASAFGALHAARFSAHPAGPSAFLPALAVAVVLGAFTARRIAGQLGRLGAAVERLDLREASLRVPEQGDDEVVALARAFNRMADRLQAEERARRQLFADVAHELRHPLAVLQGRLEMMQDGVVPLDGEQVLHLQDMVIALTRLVGDLRDLSLAEVGGLSLHLGPVDLTALIRELRENLEPVALARRIGLEANPAPDLPLLNADADRLRQVLVNLLANALQHTPEGGRVTVRAWADDRSVRVEVADTGPGIAPEDLPHVFERFYRADRARNRATGGSGLGLAIVRSLVQLHGGTATVDSRPGAGSRFIVTLPRG